MDALRNLDRQITNLQARYDSTLGFKEQPFVPTAANLDAVRDEIAGAKKAVPAGAQSPVAEPLSYHIDETLTSLKARIDSDQAYPDRYVSGMMRKVNAQISLTSPAPEARIKTLQALLNQGPAILDAAAHLGAQVPEAQRNMLMRYLAGLSGFVDNITPAFKQAFASVPADALNWASQGLENLVRKAADVSASLKARPLPAASQAYLGPDYESTMRDIYGIPLSTLIDWHKQEVELCHERLYAAAREYDPGCDPFHILQTDIGPYDSPDKLLPAMEHYLAIVREETFKYMTLPEGEHCAVWPVPEYLRTHYPWGGYFSGGDMVGGNLSGAVFLNLYNYRTLTKGWVMLNAMHEVYPGHHAHAVKTAAGNMPLSFKLGTLQSRSSALSEGVAVRTETLFKDLLDPAFPVFTAFRRLHTATRIWVDLTLHHFTQGEEAAVELYTKYLKFSRTEAQGQVYSPLLTPGYFTIYYYGVKRLEEMQKELGYNDHDFTEPIFGSGKISLETLHRLMKLSPADRAQIVGNFNPTGAH